MKAIEMRDDAERGDKIYQSRAGPAFEESNDGRKTGENEKKANDDGEDEADDLSASHSGGDATHGQIGASHQPASDKAAENNAVIGGAEIVDCDNDRKGQDKSQKKKNP